jgi:hypothetical protein
LDSRPGEAARGHHVLGRTQPRREGAAIDEFWACVDEEWPVWFVCTPQTVRDGNEPYFDPKDDSLPEGWDMWSSFTIDEFHKTGLPNASGKKGSGTKFADAAREIKAQASVRGVGHADGRQAHQALGCAALPVPRPVHVQVAVGQDVAGGQQQRLSAQTSAAFSAVARRTSTRLWPRTSYGG